MTRRAEGGGEVILYAATSNKGKLAEFAASASGAGIEVLALPGLKTMPEPVEDADTFMGNAEKKAVAYSRCLHWACWCLPMTPGWR